MLDILVKLVAHVAVTAFLSCTVVWFVGLTKTLIDEPGKGGTFKDMLAFGATMFSLIFLAIATVIALAATGWLAWSYCLMIT